MKRLKITTGLLVIVFAVLTVISCKDNKKEHDHKDAETEQTTKIDVDEQHLAYACPMKCEGDKTYENAGSCPVCGMDLKEVANSDEDKSEINDKMAMIYGCPMKCEGDKTYDKAGSCPNCGMDLKEMKRHNN